MPRKTSPPATAPFRRRPGFNEAAARCRGKRTENRNNRTESHASMRPRPDAAENAAPLVAAGVAKVTLQ